MVIDLTHLMKECNENFSSKHHMPCICLILNLTIYDLLKHLDIEAVQAKLAKGILNGYNEFGMPSIGA